MSNLTVQNENGFLSLMQQALTTPNIDMSVLKDMLAMQKEVMAQQAVIDFNNDFSLMSNEIPIIQKSKDSYSGKYAPLEDIVSLTRPVLSKHGFSISFKNEQVSADLITIVCQLRHKAGHMIENSMTLPTSAVNKGMNPMQAIGAAVSYGKRYTLCGVLNIATADDNDNNGFTANAKLESAKKYVSDNQLAKAIEQINSGDRKLEDFVGRFELTPEQLIKIGREVKA